jgi:hypothetical protein
MFYAFTIRKANRPIQGATAERSTASALAGHSPIGEREEPGCRQPEQVDLCK